MDTAALDKWNTIDEEAHTQIEFTLRDVPARVIINANTAKEAWDKLSKRYKGKGKQRIIQLISHVYNTKFTDSEPLEDQMNTLLNAV
jgi:hypothetical protein